MGCNWDHLPTIDLPQSDNVQFPKLNTYGFLENTPVEDTTASTRKPGLEAEKSIFTEF